MGEAPTPHPFTLSQGASPIKQLSAPVATSSPAPEHSPRPKQLHPSPDPVDDMPLRVTMSKATSEGLPNSKWWEIPPLYKILTWSCSEAFSQDTSLVRETREEYLKDTPPTSLWRVHMTCKRSSGIWLRLLSYLAWPFMKSRKYGRGQTSCNKLTMHWGLYQKALNSSEHYPIRVPKGYGTGGHTWPRCTMPLQWHDQLPLVQEGGPEWGDNCQLPSDHALQAQPGMQQMLQLPVNLIGHPLPPWPAELPTLQRGRPQWVRLIQVAASRRHAELISPNWKSEQKSQGELSFPQTALSGTPPPINTALEENQMENVPPTNLQHPVTCFPTHLDQEATH